MAILVAMWLYFALLALHVVVHPLRTARSLIRLGKSIIRDGITA